MSAGTIQLLPRFGDGLTWAYVDCCRLEKEDQSIAVYSDEGAASLPVSALAALMMGPGTTLTHAAARILAENGCSMVWCGQDGVRFYAASTGETRHSRNLMRQAWLSTREEPRLAVVARMYALRFPDPLEEDLTLLQIRGKEGARVRDAYAKAAAEHGIEWQGRSYNRGAWDHSDPMNRALSAANACLYGICHAAALSLGYSPALGFIHTGKQLSFIYDLADLYKMELSVPVAFSQCAQGHDDLERRVRMEMRTAMHEAKLLKRIPKDLVWLMEVPFKEAAAEDPYAADPALPNALWEPASGADVPLPPPGERP